MATLAYRTLSNRAVEKLEVEKDTVFWDRELTGFGVRVYPTGGKVYVAQARGPDGPKRVTVGRHSVVGAEQARQRAALIIARVKAGEAPVPEPLAVKQTGGPTVSELAERFLKEYAAARYKTGTIAWTRTVLGRYILPQFGNRRRSRVAWFISDEHAFHWQAPGNRKRASHESVSGKPGAVNLAGQDLRHPMAPIAPLGANATVR